MCVFAQIVIDSTSVYVTSSAKVAAYRVGYGPSGEASQTVFKRRFFAVVRSPGEVKLAKALS